MNHLKIEIVSDIMCPWCIIGYKNLEAALKQLSETIEAKVSWWAFELNPDMPKAGLSIDDYLQQKYGLSAIEGKRKTQQVTEAGKKAGFTFNFDDDRIMINSFDCHRLLLWSKQYDKQTALKLAFFDAHFTNIIFLNEQENLLKVVASVGLDKERAQVILDGDEYANEVRAEQQKAQQMGISAVPTFIINEKYSISGGQAVETFVQALTQISEEALSA